MDNKTQKQRETCNVYRTKRYIVEQRLTIQIENYENNVIVSHDVFYERTKLRDFQYELAYCARKNIDGKRLPTNMSIRTYKK